MSSIRENLLGTGSNYYKRKYKEEKEKRDQLKNEIGKSFSSNGIEVNVNNFGTQRVALPIQERLETIKSSQFNYKNNSLERNLELEKEYQNVKKTEEYKKQEQKLIEQSNKVGYAKYDYDQSVVNEDNIGWFDKSIGTVLQGAKSVFDYSGGLVKNENGDFMYLPNKTELKQQKVQDSYDTEIGKFLGNAGYEIGKIAGTTVINKVLPGAGSVAYFGKMYVDSTNNAIRDGYDTSSATVYGLVSVASEYLTGKFLGSATKGLTGGKTNAYETLLSNAFNKIIKKPMVSQILANAGSEATEEFIQEYLDNITKLAILDKSSNIDDYTSILTDTDIFADALYSAGIGAISGGVFGSVESIRNKNNNKIYQIYKDELLKTKKEISDKNKIEKIDKIIKKIDKIDTNKTVNEIVQQEQKKDNIQGLQLPNEVISSNNISQTNTNSNSNLSIIDEMQNNVVNEQNDILPYTQHEIENFKNGKVKVVQNQNADTSTSSKAEVNLPTVQDIVNQEKSSQNSVNLPVYNQQSNITNSDKAILPTVNDFNSSNINMSTSNIKVDIAKIKPEILEDIKGFKLGDASIESYKGSYIKTMLNEVGIKVPNAMNYVSEVRPDMSFTTTKDLTRQQYSSISNALQKLRSVDVTSVNNANYTIPIGNYQYVKSSNANINELRRTASMYLNNTARSNNTIKLLENIIKDRNYIIRFNPNITNEQGVPVNGLITKENGKTIIELNPNADNYVEFLVVHEITHDIATKEMKELILDYAKQDPEFEKSLESLKERYKTNDVSDEVVADVCGELFGNREFIQSVVEKKPNIFKKVLNNIRKLAEKIKGTRANEYVSFVEKLKTMWEEAYYSNRSNLSETKYSTIGIKGAKNLEINSNERRYNRLYAYLKTAKDIADQNKGKSLETRNIETKKQTQWYQTKYGDWATIISDKDSKLTKKLYPNKTYKLGEILKHDLLYKAYPGLEKLRVKTVDSINATGAFESIKGLPTNTLTTDILLKNSDINKKDFRKTILHEVNHFIEGYEKFNKNSRGANHGNMTIDEYRNNLGEIISNETKILADLTQDELDNIILFEQGKTNPQDKNIRKAIDLSNKMDKRSGQNNNINSAGYSGQNKVQMVSQNNIKNNKDNILKKLFHDEELENSSFSNNHKQKQLDIIKSNNPVNDDYHTWIRNVEDIKTLEETINDSDWSDYDEYNPDLSRQDIENAIDSGKIMVYSSYPIKQGVFVSPSKMEAESYSSNGKVYSKEVNINDVAWIDPTQGQYAKVYDILPTKYSQNTKEWNDYLKENFPSSGTKTYTKDILPTNINMQNNGNNTNNLLPTKEYFESKINNDIKKGIIETKINKMLQSTSYKAVNKAAKTGQSYLTFNNNAKRHFKERLMSFVGKTKDEIIGTNSWNDIKNLVKEYSNKDLVYVDEELKSVKSGIRKTKIKINDALKNQITDYNEFRKDNFGKLNLSNEGIDIDSYYQELSEQYPQYFGSSTTSADMLYELSDFMNKDINIVEKFQFDDAYIEQTTAKIYNTLIQGTLNEQEINDIRNSLEDKMNARTRERVQAELLAEMGITESDISQGNDISSINLSRTDPIRVNEKVFGTKIGEKINNATIRKTQQNEAERIRFLNKERNEISKLGIKAFSKESAAVQKYGEKQYINEKGDVVLYGDNELASEFPNIKTQEKIKSAARVIRQKYDIYIDQINNVLVDMGYQPIKKRNDYMRHFQALNDVFSKYGIPLNPESLQSDSLPTDINGLTDQFKPGKQYFANAMQRMGLKTEYDAITGIDGYLEGASNLIYHTEDIQRYRTLSKFIRNTYGAEHGFEDFAKMNLEQQEQRLKDIQLNKLAKYVSWLDEQANALANKKGKIDRGFEELFGRKVYNILQTAKNQVGSNMVGFNVRSALTNFASVVQGASKTNKIAFVKGTISAVNNIINNDGLVYKSDFLTRRFGSDRLSQKLWQKATNAGFSLMTGTDYFTANQIWRSKYYEYLDKGMTESEAIRGADDFSARIMGDRSKGSTATIFNSKTLGFFTQFQLEVNNQWSSLIHDNKIDIEKGNKTASSVIFELGQLFAFSYLFNNLMKSLTGSDVMIDPIELLQIILGDDDDDDDLEERATKVLGEIVNNLPFASIFTGGRIPIGEAFKGIETGFKYATGQTDKYGNNYELEDVSNDMIESAFYWILPTGYSQLNKTVKGLSMYDKKLPIKGSYTEGGNLRFTADESLSGKIKSALFGQYSSKEAQDYIDSNFQTIPKGKIAEMKELGMNSSEYRNYRKGLSNAGKTNEEKLNYINSLKLPIETKNIMANNIVNSDKYKINMGEYNNFDSYEEMKYSYENPIKYSTIKQITTYKKYNTYKEEIERVKDNYENSNQRKYAVINYVNDLNLSIPQKAMLIKMNYSSFTDYDSTIINYINSQDLTIQEKTDILTELGFTVRDGRVYSK